MHTAGSFDFYLSFNDDEDEKTSGKVGHFQVIPDLYVGDKVCIFDDLNNRFVTFISWFWHRLYVVRLFCLAHLEILRDGVNILK